MATFEYIKPKGTRSSPTMSAGQLAAKAKSLGVDILTFTLGDLFPKPTEQEISGWLDQLKKEKKYPLRPDTQSRGYAPPAGLPSLLEAAADQFSRDTGINVSAAQVRAGHGGKGTLFAAFRHFEAKERPATIVVAAPGWPTNYDLFPAGARIIEVDSQGRGLMSPPQLKEALKKYPQPDCIFINTPCNPTGANYSPEQREELLSIVNSQTKQSVVAFDDPYGKLVFDREPYDIKKVLQRGPVEKALFEQGRVAVFRTASKEYGMADSRVGWLITKNADYLTSVQNINESEVGGVSGRDMEEVVAAIAYGDGFIERTVKELKEKRQKVIDGLEKLQYARAEAPQGTIYSWIDLSGLKGKFVPSSAIATDAARTEILSDAERKAGGFTIKTPADMMRYLAYVAGICPVQGTPFYAPGSPFAQADWHIRFTFCGELEDLKKGLAQLKAAEAKLNASSTLQAV